MADIKWIKIATDIFDDEKILLIESLPDADAIIVIWFKLLCLAGKSNNSGVFMINDTLAVTDTMLATIFRRKESTVKLALETFERFGMIETIDGVITIPNWGKHQNLDQLELKRDYMRGYMRNYREKQKQIACKVNGKTNSKANVSEADKIRIDKNKNNNNIVKREPFDGEFEALWSRYPRKQGKKDALRHYVSARKKGATYEEISQGLDNYLKYIEAKNIETQFIKHGSAWFCQHSWEDEYENPDYETSEERLNEWLRSRGEL